MAYFQFFLIILTAVDLIQALPYRTQYPEEKLPGYLIECPCSTKEGNGRLTGIQYQDTAVFSLPSDNSTDSDEHIEMETDFPTQQIEGTSRNQTYPIDEQIIKNVLTHLFALLDGIDQSSVNKRSVEVKANDEKLKEENEKQNRLLKYEFISRLPAIDDYYYSANNYPGADKSSFRIYTSQNRTANFVSIPHANYPFVNGLTDATNYIYANPVFSSSSYSMLQPTLFDPYSGRIVVDPFWDEQQTFPIVPSTLYPQPIGYYAMKIVKPETTNDGKPSAGNVKDEKQSESRLLPSAESESMVAQNTPSRDNKIPPATSFDENMPSVEMTTISSKNLTASGLERKNRTKITDVIAKNKSSVPMNLIKTNKDGKTESPNFSYFNRPGANEMTRLAVAGDRRNNNPSIKPIDAKTKPYFSVKKKQQTPVKPSTVDPKIMELNQLMDKMREIKAQIRASMLRKDRNNQPKLHS